MRETGRFLWHFRAPWRERFDHSAWWDDEPENVPLIAAAWEMFRRHPNIGSLLEGLSENVVTIRDGRPGRKVSFFEDFIWRYAKLPWTKLKQRHQARFEKRIATRFSPQLGFLPQQAVTLLNDWRAFQKVIEPKARGALYKRLASALRTNSLLHHRAGHLLIAIDPTAPARRIENGVKEAVKDWAARERVDPGKKRPGKKRVGQWLSIIAEFEEAELTRKGNTKRDDQLFAQYRRTIRNWWPVLIESDRD